MQITLELKGLTSVEACRAIMAIAAYAGVTVDFPETNAERPASPQIQAILDKMDAERVRDIVVNEVIKIAPKPDPINHTSTDAAIEPDAAAIFGAVAPFAPATVDAAAQQTAPVVQPATSLPTPPAMPLPVAMPAAITSAPAAAAPTAPAPSVDKDGLPWDARIHSSSKALNADGRWRAKKGLNDGAMVAAVQAELRALMAIPAPPAMPAAPVVVASAFVAPTTLPEFMPLVSAAMMAGKLTVDHMDAELVAIGVVGGVTALMARQDLVPSLWATLQAKYAL